jgi:hypothetical protein
LEKRNDNGLENMEEEEEEEEEHGMLRGSAQVFAFDIEETSKET